MGSQENALLLIRGIIWLWRQRLGRAFMLAIASWAMLTVLWNYCADGSTGFKIIAALFDPGFFIGRHIADAVSASPFHAALIGLGGILLIYTVIWYAIIRLTSAMRTEERINNS